MARFDTPPAATNAGEKIRRPFEDHTRRQEAWATLGVPETAPTRARQSSLERARTVRGWLLAAMRTLGNGGAKRENVEEATRIVDRLFAALRPGAERFEKLAKWELVACVMAAVKRIACAPAALRDEERHVALIQHRRAYEDRYGRSIDPALFGAAVDEFVTSPRGGWNAGGWKATARLLESAGFGPQGPRSLATGWNRRGAPAKPRKPKSRHRTT